MGAKHLELLIFVTERFTYNNEMLTKSLNRMRTDSVIRVSLLNFSPKFPDLYCEISLR